ncbi:MAG: SAM-dependent methyltransferase protein [Devosia sp.]|nr:SAM-dependent methyltransferase protein [Devosia sp.]
MPIVANAPASLERSFGREAFGADPANYHAARPPYPEATWQALAERAGLRSGIDILEIGAGTGLATLPLLSYAPTSLVAVEPDARLAAFLGHTVEDSRLSVIAEPFEEVELPSASFDLVVSATAFHWLDPVPALTRIHGLLRRNGDIALLWNVFGDSSRSDPFHEATTQLFAGHRHSTSGGGSGQTPFALDMSARLGDFAASGFIADAPEFRRWTLELDPDGVRALYATYSNVTALPAPERLQLLDGLAEIAAQHFGGRVERNMTTVIYTARRAPDVILAA